MSNRPNSGFGSIWEVLIVLILVGLIVSVILVVLAAGGAW